MIPQHGSFPSNSVSPEDVEWYSGKNLQTHPVRIKVNGVWEDVFYYEKCVYEDKATRKRTTIFQCHIGDNRFIRIVV